MLLSRGDVGTLMGWLSALPAPLLEQRPELSVIYALVHIYTLRLDTTAQWLDRADAALATSAKEPSNRLPATGEDPETSRLRQLRGQWHAVRGYWVRLAH